MKAPDGETRGSAGLEAAIRPINELSSSHPLPREAYASRLTLELLCALLQRTLRCSHALGRPLPDDDARSIALIRRAQTEQLFAIRAWLPATGDDCAQALHLAAMTLETGAALAQRLDDTPLRQAVQFLLPEMLDALYRLANLLRVRGGPSASALLGHQLEIMPGRPLPLCHRHPADDVASPGVLPSEEMEQLLMLSAVEALRSACCQAAFRTEEELDRGLFLELTLIGEQHETLLSSLSTPREPLLALRLHQAAVWWLLDSLSQLQSGNAALCRLAVEEGCHALAQKNAIDALVQRLVPGAPPPPPFPPPFLLGPCKGCVRDALQEIGHTLLRGRPVPVSAMPRDGDSARYRRALCPDAAQSPAHMAVEERIAQAGQDERFEIARHPVPSLRDRTRDAVSLDPADEPSSP